MSAKKTLHTSDRPHIVLLGPPGVGKGTMGALLEERLKIPRLVVGDLLREEQDKGTKFGNYVKSLISKGNFVPDEEIIVYLLEKLRAKQYDQGVIFDGFPRTMKQAQAMEEHKFHVDYVFSLEAPEKVLIERLSNRRTCSGCKQVFNLLTLKPVKEGVCDNCHGKLIQRDDDKPKEIHHRLEVYREKTAPVVEFYKDHHSFYPINGVGKPEEVLKRILCVLK